MAIGLPATAARNIDGIAWGWLGAGAYESVRGIAAGGLGVGAGQDLVGIASGGLGVGAGEDLTGIAIGGLGVGVGAGESMTGIFNYARHLNGVQIGLLNWAGNSRAKLLPIVNAHFD